MLHWRERRAWKILFGRGTRGDVSQPPEVKQKHTKDWKELIICNNAQLVFLLKRISLSYFYILIPPFSFNYNSPLISPSFSLSTISHARVKLRLSDSKQGLCMYHFSAL